MDTRTTSASRPGALPAACLLAAVLLAACATTTTTAVWTNPQVAAHRVASVLVMAVAEDQIARRKYEDALARALRARGVDSAVSYALLPESRKLTQEQIDQAVRTRGFQAVLITHVTGVNEETVYVPGYVQTFRRPVYSGYYGYYAWTYDQVFHPGYYDTFTTVSLETSLYEAPSGRPAWGMRSRSVDPHNLDALVESLVSETVHNLAAAGFI